jgi:hypothetical protein
MPSDRAKLAREHLARAAPHIPDGDETQAITWLHLAGEAAIDALAEVHGIDTKKSHPAKARAARELFKAGHISVDLNEPLNVLNEARKSTNYDRSSPNLRG